MTQTKTRARGKPPTRAKATTPAEDEHPYGLPCPLLLDTSDFAEVLEYLGEWAPRPPSAQREGRPTGKKNQIGPYCTIDLSQLGGPQHRSIAARASDATMNALRGRIVTDDDQISFKLIAHKETGRVLVIAQHGQIIGSHWLAYVTPDTLPPYPYAQRDERVQEICESLREADKTSYVRHRDDGSIEVRPSDRDGNGIKALIDALGGLTRTWPDGSKSHEEPRDPQEARRAAAQLARHPSPPASAGEVSAARVQALAQQTLFSATDALAAMRSANSNAPVRSSTVETSVIEVLARVQVSDGFLALPDQLERSQYEAVNKVLVALGGKWNRRRAGHVFPAGQPIAEELAEVIETKVLNRELTGYFPTPQPLAEQLVALADISAQHLVLEPSAGRGAIADLLAAIVPPGQLYILERDPAHHQALERAGYHPPQLILDDFLTTTALPGEFDRIVMNPPFEAQQDIAHVMRAYELLAPNGRLVAITSAGLEFRKDARTRALRELIEACPDGSLTKNPADAFKASGAGVRTLTVALTKPPALQPEREDS
jgi:predicted RNA methylase